MWLNLEIILQNEVSQKERTKHCKISLTCGIWKNDTDELIRRAESRHRCREQMYGYQGQKGVGGLERLGLTHTHY